MIVAFSFGAAELSGCKNKAITYSFTFKQIERRKLANAPNEVKYIPGLLVNRIDRYGVVQVDMESLEKNSDDDEEEEEDTSSSRGRSRYGRGSTRGSSRK